MTKLLISLTKKNLHAKGLSFLLLCVFLLFTSAMFAQTTIVRGKITDAATGEGIPGANVMVKGTATGTVTGNDGNYSLTAPSNGTLAISFIGFKKFEISIAGKSEINIVLEAETIGLEEVVAIGYGVIKKSDLTGSVSSLKSDEVKKSTTANALQVMQGKVAGVDVYQNSGQAGSGVYINLRGTRSINATNAPLILVDGVVYGSTLDINPSDIASIEVLKDGASTAIYGTRGANGVILITTKKGGTGKTQINFNSYVAMNSPSYIPNLMNAAQFKQKRFETLIADEENRLFNLAGISYNATTGAVTWNQTTYPDPAAGFGTINLDKIMQIKGVTDPNKLLTSDPTALQLLADGVSLDYLDMIFKNSITQNYELGFNGGTNKTAVNFSLGIMQDQGLLRNDEMRRYNVKLGMDHQISNAVKAGASILFTNKKYDRRNSSIFNQALKTGPIGTMYNADGTYKDFPDNVWTTAQPNPLIDEVKGSNVNEIMSNRLFSSAYLSIELMKGLTFKTNLGADLRFEKTGLYQSPKSLARLNANTANTQMTNFSSWSYVWDNLLNFSKQFGINDVQLMAGSATSANQSENYVMTGIGQLTPVTEFYDWKGFASTTSDSRFVASQMQSFFGRLNYKLLDKYLLQATYRIDGSSILSSGNKWMAFPSASVGWLVSKEGFLADSKWLNNLKFRLSWGIAGNAAIEPYQSYTLVGEKQIYTTLDGTIYSSYAPGQAGNKNLTWETTATYDIGLDFGILRNRINGTIDYYQSKSSDLLFEVPLPTTSVFPVVMTNLAKSKNSGIEVYINTQNGKTGNFEWNTDWNFSLNRDEVVALRKGSDGEEVTKLVRSNGYQIWQIGEPVNNFYYYEKQGFYSTADLQAELDYIKAQTSTGATIERGKIPMVSNKFLPGDIKLKDLNTDGIFNDLDKTIHSTSPKYTFGINNNFNYQTSLGNIGLSFMIYGRMGQFIRYDHYLAYKFATQTVENGPYVDAWTPQDTKADFPRYSSAGNGIIEMYRNALGYVDGSFLKIKEITLSYTLPAGLLRNAKISNMKFYATAKNMFTFNKLGDYDTELGGSMNFPLAKQFIFGVNIDL